MADPVTRADRGGGKKNGEFLGQPGWIWLAGAGVVVLGYLYLRAHPSTPASGSGTGTGQQGAGTPTGWTTETFKTWTTQHHGHPKKHTKSG